MSVACPTPAATDCSKHDGQGEADALPTAQLSKGAGSACLTLESGRSYPLDVDTLVLGKWTTIVRFQLHVPEASDLGRFLPYSNDHDVMAALLDPKP